MEGTTPVRWCKACNKHTPHVGVCGDGKKESFECVVCLEIPEFQEHHVVTDIEGGHIFDLVSSAGVA